VPALHDLFSYLCGQSHSWAPGGIELPFCERCTGLYVGAVPAFLLYLLFKPRPTSRVLWIHGLLLLLMPPFGYHVFPQNAEVRTLTGQLFAFGLIYYLTLLPADRLQSKKRDPAQDLLSYAIAGLVTLPLLQLAVHLGGLRTNEVLSWIGFSGLVVYAMLVAANLMLLPPALWSILRRQPDASSS
jgi:uncharacterized membrane protein